MGKRCVEGKHDEQGRMRLNVAAEVPCCPLIPCPPCLHPSLYCPVGEAMVRTSRDRLTPGRQMQQAGEIQNIAGKREEYRSYSATWDPRQTRTSHDALGKKNRAMRGCHTTKLFSHFQGSGTSFISHRWYVSGPSATTRCEIACLKFCLLAGTYVSLKK